MEHPGSPGSQEHWTGLRRPGGPGDSPTLAPLLYFEAGPRVGGCGGSTPRPCQKSLFSTCTACRSQPPSDR